MTTTLTLTSEGVNYRRLRDMGGLLAAELEVVVTNPPAPSAEVDVPRLVVVTRGEYSNYEIDGVVELTAAAPDIGMLRSLFTEHIRSIRGVDLELVRDTSLIEWLVERGFARRVAAAEWNFAVYGWLPMSPIEVVLDEYTCPRKEG